MKLKLKLIALLLSFTALITSSGVFAAWVYAEEPLDPVMGNAGISIFPWVELDPEEMMSVAEKFRAILNNDIELSAPIVINGVQYNNSYDTLMAAFDDRDAINYRNDSYIGTMQDEGDDVESIITMFDEAFEAEQKENPHYNMMLKRENVDSDDTTGISFFMNGNNGWGGENQYRTGCEVILYSTNVEITREAIANGDYIAVQATVFTRQPTGQKQHTYNGTKYPVYHYVVNAGSPNGYEVEVYKRGNRYYRTDNDQRVSASAYYPVYDYTGSEWTQIGSYEGEALAVNYSAGSDAPSFSTDDWRSTENFGYGTGLTLARCVYYTLR